MLLDPERRAEFLSGAAACRDRRAGPDDHRDTDPDRFRIGQQREAVVLHAPRAEAAELSRDPLVPELLVLRPVDPGKTERGALNVSGLRAGDLKRLPGCRAALSRRVTPAVAAVDVADAGPPPTEDGPVDRRHEGDGLRVAGVDAEIQPCHFSRRSGR